MNAPRKLAAILAANVVGYSRLTGRELRKLINPADEVIGMRRREFIALLAGATSAWPLAVRVQQPDRMRRIGVLMAYAEDDLETRHSSLSAGGQRQTPCSL